MTMTVPTEREEAETYLLAEMARCADELERLEARRALLYERRRELYDVGRRLSPPVPGRKMAKAARVSDAALVLSSGRTKKPTRPKATDG